MSIAAINTKVSEAVTAHEAGDIDTALTKLRSARMLLNAKPNSTGPDGSKLEWDRRDIDLMIKDLEKEKSKSLAAASGGIQRTKTNYVNPTT